MGDSREFSMNDLSGIKFYKSANKTVLSGALKALRSPKTKK